MLPAHKMGQLSASGEPAGSHITDIAVKRQLPKPDTVIKHISAQPPDGPGQIQFFQRLSADTGQAAGMFRFPVHLFCKGIIRQFRHCKALQLLWYYHPAAGAVTSQNTDSLINFFKGKALFFHPLPLFLLCRSVFRQALIPALSAGKSCCRPGPYNSCHGTR